MINNSPMEVNTNERRVKVKTNARQRWRILAKAIQLQKRQMIMLEDAQKQQSQSLVRYINAAAATSRKVSVTEEVLCASVRRFGTFDLIQCQGLVRRDENNNSRFEETVERLCGRAENWFEYTLQLESGVYSMNIHHISQAVSVKELMGFNNTGNVCLWPSEEALSAYILDNRSRLRGGSVLELGGGMTCLAGLFVAKYCSPLLVHLTDGNRKSVENVQRILRLNELEGRCFVRASILKWELLLRDSAKYDFILTADCLFFDETRDALIDAIATSLSRRGEAWVMAPRRGNTLQQFVDRCQAKGLAAGVVVRYNDEIWHRFMQLKKSRVYNEDIHYPILIVVTQRSESAADSSAV